MNLQHAVEQARLLAESEIEKYGLPTLLHLQLSVNRSRAIARELKANEELVLIGVYLMDVKLGQAFKEGKLAQHVDMSVLVAKQFVLNNQLTAEDGEIVVDSVASHHGRATFQSLEAEIVANADCYRFIHPTGVFHYIGTLVRRGLDHNAVLSGAEAKLDEKAAILSLDLCKKELGEYISLFKRLFSMGRL